MDIQRDIDQFKSEISRNHYFLKNLEKNFQGDFECFFQLNKEGGFLLHEAKLSFEAWKTAKASVAEGFVLVSKELPETIAEAMALERVPKPFGETDPVWIEISERSYRDSLLRKKWDLWRDYKAMIEAQEPAK